MSSAETTDQSLRLRFFRRRRPASIEEVGAQVWQLLDALAALHPGWKQWSTRDAAFQPHRVRSAAECSRYLGGAEIELAPGNRPSHRLVFTCSGSREQSCDVRVLFALQGSTARWDLGLRVEMRVGSFVRGLGASGAALVQEVVLAAVKAVQPHAGFAGTMVSPPQRWDESREPEAAWMTYLSRAANAEPFLAIYPDPKLASAPSAQPPAVVAPVLELGWLIVAFPGIMSTSDAGQTAAVDGVRRALGPRVRQDALAVANEDPGGFAPNAPAHAGSQASSEALSPWDKRAKSGKAGTLLGVEVSRPTPLPFAQGGTPSEALERAVQHAEQVQGPRPSEPEIGLASTADALDLSAILQALPFAKGASRGAAPPLGPARAAPPAHPVTPALTLEQHASLCVEIARSPAHTAETLARYRITPQEKVLVDQYYRDGMAASPEIRAAWERSYQSYQVWLQTHQGRTR
jgi:hypothetical protein